MKIRIFLNYISFFSITSAIVLIGVFTFWYSYPYKVIDFTSITLDKTTFHKGEVLAINISICKYMPIPAKMTRQFVNDIIYTLGLEATANSNTGCRTNKAVDIKIPEELPASVYVYRQTNSYKVNPIRTINVVFETPKFTVVE